MNEAGRIYVAGHRGLVGSAVVRELRRRGHENLLLRTSAELDLRNQAAVAGFFAAERPEYVILAAAKVGGIHANDSFPADFIRDNLQIETNVIDSAWLSGTKKLCFLGSSCIYPKLAPQPMREDMLLTGPLEPTNEWYAIAKIAGIKLCQAYRSTVSTRLRSCRPTCTARATTSTCRIPTCCRRCCAGFTMQPRAARPRWWSGARERRAASSCTSTTWPTPACS
jgi:GDP-L-fucose synthase